MTAYLNGFTFNGAMSADWQGVGISGTSDKPSSSPGKKELGSSGVNAPNLLAVDAAALRDFHPPPAAAFCPFLAES